MDDLELVTHIRDVRYAWTVGRGRLILHYVLWNHDSSDWHATVFPGGRLSPLSLGHLLNLLSSLARRPRWTPASLTGDDRFGPAPSPSESCTPRHLLVIYSLTAEGGKCVPKIDSKHLCASWCLRKLCKTTQLLRALCQTHQRSGAEPVIIGSAHMGHALMTGFYRILTAPSL